MTEEAPIDPSSADFSVVEGGDPVNVVKTTHERDAAKQHCCSWTRFGGVRMAQGYCINGVARGAIIMSNIYLTSSLIYLASKEIGCVDKEDEVNDDCTGKVYGMTPSALVANIATISGILSALFMPLFGAITDYTDHRWMLGVVSSAFMTVIQAVQIGTVSATWFPMAVLQAIAGFLYQVEVLAIYAYLPDIARTVGEEKMTLFQAFFTMTQFAAQASYLILITAISIGIGLSTVVTAQMSQGINVVWITLAFIVSWRMMPHIPASHDLPEGSRLFTAGFVQVYHTAVNIFKEYRSSLWWYFWAVVFAEAGANAFTVMAVIYLSDQIGMNGTEVGIFFLVSLIGTIPGSRLGAFVTRRLNPKRSWQLALAIISVVTIVGALTLNQDVKNVSYVWGFFIGLMLGWHYPTEGLIFSMCLPKGQDTELCGFYVYCTQILVWLPPLIFSALVNNGVSQNYGTITIVFFFIVAVVLINMLPSWPEVLADVRKHDVEDGYEVHDEPDAKGGVPDANGCETVDAGETSEPKA